MCAARVAEHPIRSEHRVYTQHPHAHLQGQGAGGQHTQPRAVPHTSAPPAATDARPRVRVGRPVRITAHLSSIAHMVLTRTPWYDESESTAGSGMEGAERLWYWYEMVPL